MGYEQYVNLTLEHSDKQVLERLRLIMGGWTSNVDYFADNLQAELSGSWIYEEKARLRIYREDVPRMHDLLVGIDMKLDRDRDDHFYFDLKALTVKVPGLRVIMEYRGEDFDDSEVLTVEGGKVVHRQVRAWVDAPITEG